MMNVEQERITPKNPIARPRWFYKQWMLAGNPAYFFEMLSREFGDFVHYRGLFDFYLINDPALVKQVLQETHEAFDKQSVIYKRFANVFGTLWRWSSHLHWNSFRYHGVDRGLGDDGSTVWNTDRSKQSTRNVCQANDDPQRRIASYTSVCSQGVNERGSLSS